MNKPPCLFGKHSKIERVKITEAHAPSILWTTKLAPIDPVNFLLIFGLAPPILWQYEIYAITNRLGKFKYAHGVGWYCLSHRFN